MRRLYFPSCGNRWGLALVCALAFVLPLPLPAVAQSPLHGQASAAELSRAEQEAEQKVSLSAEKIIEILRGEPGLLLAVKKTLGRKAYEQGRILEPADLSDQALFRLLFEDENIRILATREIEDRLYVRAKPTREEIEREQELAARTAPSAGSRGQQVDTDWSQPDREPREYGTPSRVDPPYPPATARPAPRKSEPQNPARAVDRAGRQRNHQDDEDTFAGWGVNASRVDRVHPEELADCLSAEGRAGTEQSGSGGPLAGAGTFPQSAGRELNSSPEFSDPDPRNRFPERVSRSRLEDYRRTVPSPADRNNNNNNEDRPRIRHRPNPYADVPSLYDLYAQVARRPPMLERFGMDVFRNGTGNLDDLPMDLPAGPDYVLGPGDGLSIELWGGVAQRLQRVVDREGQVALPEVGTVQVSGRSLGEVQRVVQAALRTQFRDVEADVSLARIRSVRVYVVGDVASPGAYDISSLSTALNALYAAGGPTSRGSLRHLRQYRGSQLVGEIDTYDLLLHGIHGELARLQSGDTILVPPIGPELTVEGMVRRPAIYELDGEKSLAEALELAGGVLPSGALRQVDVERVVAHEKRTLLRLDLPESKDLQAVNRALEEFQVQDGDTVKISPILPYADQTVYLDGHVFRPGKYPYRDGMKVTDILHSYSDLLPEPSRRHAEIIRLEAPDYTPVVLAFSLGDAMEGKDQSLVLKPFDTIRVFGRFDFEDPPVITVTGEVRDPGDHLTNGVTRLRDAVYLAGGVTADAELNDAQVFRKSGDGKLKVLSVNLGQAMAGDPTADILLAAKDRVFIHRNPAKADPPAVLVQGEVARPGKYPLGEGMTAADLVRLAGGFKRSADTQQADLSRYLQPEGKIHVGEHQRVEIAKALAGVADADPALVDGDVLSIRQRAGWSDRGAVVTLKGEVLHPGTYGIQEGERLSSVLARAGGLRADAYPYGAVLERAQVRELESKNRVELIRHVQADGASLRLIPENDEEQKMAKEAALLQWQAALDKLQNTPPSGRLVIHISPDSKRWTNTPADLEVRAGDVLVVPKTPDFVMVSGAVYNPTAVAFKPGRNARWYLEQAGGASNAASKKAIFLIRADGSVVGGSGGLWSGGVLGAEVRPGDMLVVPERAYSGTTRWKETLQVAQLVSAAGIAVQVAKGF